MLLYTFNALGLGWAFSPTLSTMFVNRVRPCPGHREARYAFLCAPAIGSHAYCASNDQATAATGRIKSLVDSPENGKLQWASLENHELSP